MPVRTRKTLKDIHKEFKGQCIYCERKTFLPGTAEALSMPNRLATREHLVRLTDGGGNGNNIALACKECNEGREDRTVEDWKRLRSWMGKYERN